jgi:hypothetical protein
MESSGVLKWKIKRREFVSIVVESLCTDARPRARRLRVSTNHILLPPRIDITPARFYRAVSLGRIGSSRRYYWCTV